MLTSESVLQNRYRITRQIVSGRTGAVYEAQDERLGATVAVKETFISDDHLRERFEREASRLLNLNHRALPKVTNHFAEGSGQYLVMEYIVGDDLQTLIERYGRPFPFDQVMAWAGELLDALEYLHSCEPPVIHGDIKPANLKLTPQDRLMLLDFGLTKGTAPVAAPGRLLHNWQTHPYVTRALKLASFVLSGMPMPSTDSSDSNWELPLHLRYAPPEQLRCEGTDERSDLFSLAATLNHLMTGQAPVDALRRERDIGARRLAPLRPTGEPALLPLAIPAALKLAMSLNRDQRYRNAAALRQALQSATSTPLTRSLDFEAGEFLTARLDAKGQVAEWLRGQAQCFSEDFGGGVTLEMIRIPGGTFLRDADGRSPHRVTVSGFFMGKYPVTQAQWRVITQWPKVSSYLKPDPSYFKGDDLPVESVLWEEAVEFCERLSRKKGRVYRLPTEAEWEYACRAGTTTLFAFGETITPEFVNYNGDYPYRAMPKSNYRQKTVSVGSLGVANAFGLYDLHGNVREWCQDWYSDSYYEECHRRAQGPTTLPRELWWLSAPRRGVVSDPQGPAMGSGHVHRGGGWSSIVSSCQSADRNYDASGARREYIGFRLAMATQ